jgi:hypothetical protein
LRARNVACVGWVLKNSSSLLRTLRCKPDAMRRSMALRTALKTLIASGRFGILRRYKGKMYP